MKKKRFSVNQIIKILREGEGGIKVADLARKHDITEQTYYRWKKKYGGMTLSDAKRLKALEEENTRLKKKLADAILEIDLLKEINSKNW